MIQPSILHKTSGIRTIDHYTPVQHMGFPPGVRCWCGATLEFNYHEPGQNKRRQAFFALHEACEYVEDGKENVWSN